MGKLVADGQGRAKLSGPLDFDTVPALTEQLRPLLSRDASLDIDLAEVTHSNSAAAALLLDWQRQASAMGARLLYHNSPKQLCALLKFCELDEVLRLQGCLVGPPPSA